MTTDLGTPGYTAPEILEGYEYDFKVDLWSVGVILYPPPITPHPTVPKQPYCYRCHSDLNPFCAATPWLLTEDTSC